MHHRQTSLSSNAVTTLHSPEYIYDVIVCANRSEMQESRTQKMMKKDQDDENMSEVDEYILVNKERRKRLGKRAYL